MLRSTAMLFVRAGKQDATVSRCISGVIITVRNGTRRAMFSDCRREATTPGTSGSRCHRGQADGDINSRDGFSCHDLLDNDRRPPACKRRIYDLSTPTLTPGLDYRISRSPPAWAARLRSHRTPQPRTRFPIRSLEDGLPMRRLRFGQPCSAIRLQPGPATARSRRRTDPEEGDRRTGLDQRRHPLPRQVHPRGSTPRKKLAHALILLGSAGHPPACTA